MIFSAKQNLVCIAIAAVVTVATAGQTLDSVEREQIPCDLSGKTLVYLIPGEEPDVSQEIRIRAIEARGSHYRGPTGYKSDFGAQHAGKRQKIDVRKDFRGATLAFENFFESAGFEACPLREGGASFVCQVFERITTVQYKDTSATVTRSKLFFSPALGLDVKEISWTTAVKPGQEPVVENRAKTSFEIVAIERQK